MYFSFLTTEEKTRIFLHVEMYTVQWLQTEFFQNYSRILLAI
jgi:hypothetical protein